MEQPLYRRLLPFSASRAQIEYSLIGYKMNQKNFFEACEYGRLQDVRKGLASTGFFVKLLFSHIDINKRNELDRTPLMLAAEQGHIKVTKALIEAGADIQVVNRVGFTALIIVAKSSHTAVAKLLIDKGADVNAKCEGETVLSIAAHHLNLELVNYLISNGADFRTATAGHGLYKLSFLEFVILWDSFYLYKAIRL